MTTTSTGGPRIAPVSEFDEDLAARLAKAPKQPDGRPLNLFGTLAHRPKVLSLVNALGGRLMFDSIVADRERELVILRAAAHAHCEYEVRAHSEIGLKVGLTEEEIQAAVDVGAPPRGAAADIALQRLADEISADVDVSDATWAALEGVVDDDAARIELIIIVGFYRMLAGVLNGVRVAHDDDFQPPAAPSA